jgi:hypothetical protein
MTPDRNDGFTVVVPDGHPLDGLRATVYPVSGATTYTEGRLEVVSPGTIELRKAFRDLAESLAKMQEKVP